MTNNQPDQQAKTPYTILVTTDSKSVAERLLEAIENSGVKPEPDVTFTLPFEPFEPVPDSSLEGDDLYALNDALTEFLAHRGWHAVDDERDEALNEVTHQVSTILGNLIRDTYHPHKEN